MEATNKNKTTKENNMTTLTKISFNEYKKETELTAEELLHHANDFTDYISFIKDFRVIASECDYEIKGSILDLKESIENMIEEYLTDNDSIQGLEKAIDTFDDYAPDFYQVIFKDDIKYAKNELSGAYEERERRSYCRG